MLLYGKRPCPFQENLIPLFGPHHVCSRVGTEPVMSNLKAEFLNYYSTRKSAVRKSVSRNVACNFPLNSSSCHLCSQFTGTHLLNIYVMNKNIFFFFFQNMCAHITFRFKILETAFKK